MDKIKLAVAAALFILLTALKLFFPAQLDMLRDSAARLGGGRDYRTAVETMGRALSDRELGEKLVAVFREYGEEETGE